MEVQVRRQLDPESSSELGSGLGNDADLRKNEALSSVNRLASEVAELDQPISRELYFGGYAGLLSGDSYLSAARRVLTNLKELEGKARNKSVPVLIDEKLK